MAHPPPSQQRPRLALTILTLIGGLLTQHALALVKSPNDPRQYETFVLANQMRVLLICDPQTDKAAAALDVQIGSASDPVQRPGLAHFLEHMLFLGTARYPVPGEYQAFIAARGGSHNAYTAFDNTNYFFDIDSDHLEPALDRFAQFFIAPLFTPKYVNQERNIVDSEYRAKRGEDAWRSRHAYKRALNPRHPQARFSIGSRDTLADRQGSEVRAELIDFYQRHYSANLMTLVVLGKEPLATLRHWVSTQFSPVPNRNASPLAIGEPLFLANTLPARLEVIPLKQRRSITLTFPLPDMTPHYRSKPLTYIANLLGHEGRGSLLSMLKSKGWGDALVAGEGSQAGAQTTFYVTIELTETGFEHIPQIASSVFQYIRLIRERGIAPWIFDEQRHLAELAFRFQETTDPVSYVSHIARTLRDYPLEDVLRGPFRMDRFDAPLIDQVLGALNPNRVLLSVTGPELRGDTRDPWFDTSYRLSPVDPNRTRAWQKAAIDPTLALPEPNVFLPADLAISAPGETASHIPELISGEEALMLWHQQDTFYRVPRADFFFNVRSPRAHDSPRHAMLTRLYVDLVNDQLNELTYPARLAGLNYSLYDHMRGFSVRLSGYDDKQQLLLERLARALRHPILSADRFMAYKAQAERRLHNLAMEPPYEQALKELQTLLLQPSWDNATLRRALQPLTLDDLRAFVPQLLANAEVVVLSHGNEPRAQALAMSEILQHWLLKDTRPIEAPRARVVKLDPGSSALRQLSVKHRDSALALYFQGDGKDFAARAEIGLLAQVLADDFFNGLRTEKQLGYVVFASAMPLLDVPGLVFVIQSPNAGPRELTRQVEQFLVDARKRIEQLSDSAFAEHRRGFINRILEREKNLQERSERYWAEIDRERFGFDSRERLAEAAAAIGKDDLRARYQHTLIGPQRRQLAVQVMGSQHHPETAATGTGTIPEPELIRSTQTFKARRLFFPG